MQHNPFLSATIRLTGGLLVSALLCACNVLIDHKTVFQLRDSQVPVESLKLLRPSDATRIVPISLETKGASFKGYQYQSPTPRHAILFFAGSGYGAPTAMGRVVATFADETTDIYFLSYGEQNQTPPDIADMYAMASSLAQMAQTRSRLPATKLCAIGHSFGAWPTLHLAAGGGIGCAVVMGAGTNVVETSYSLLPALAAPLVRFTASAEVATLDSIALASRVAIPTLVIGSKADHSTPERFARRIYDSLAPATAREIWISENVAHETYLRDEAVTHVIRDFLQRKWGR